jgi:hypothetical protein
MVSLGFLCPPASLVAPFLGLRALVEIKSHPERRGRGLAVAGIAIGLATTLGWVCFGGWWHLRARVPMIEGPRTALVSGQAGDLAGFRAGFAAEGEAASDDEAAAFLQTLTARYGRLLGSEQDRGADAAAVPASSAPGRRRIHYLLEFESGRVAAETEFVLREAGRGGFVFRFAWIAIRDDRLGDLVYPKSAQAIADTTAPDSTPAPEPPNGR